MRVDCVLEQWVPLLWIQTFFKRSNSFENVFDIAKFTTPAGVHSTCSVQSERQTYIFSRDHENSKLSFSNVLYPIRGVENNHNISDFNSIADCETSRNNKNNRYNAVRYKPG